MIFQPAETARHNRLFWRPDLKVFMQRNVTKLAKLNDDDIAGLFRRSMTENHPKIQLPRRSRVAKQVASIRIELRWAPLADGQETAANGI